MRKGIKIGLNKKAGFWTISTYTYNKYETGE